METIVLSPDNDYVHRFDVYRNMCIKKIIITMPDNSDFTDDEMCRILTHDAISTTYDKRTFINLYILSYVHKKKCTISPCSIILRPNFIHNTYYYIYLDQRIRFDVNIEIRLKPCEKIYKQMSTYTTSSSIIECYSNVIVVTTSQPVDSVELSIYEKVGYEWVSYDKCIDTPEVAIHNGCLYTYICNLDNDDVGKLKDAKVTDIGRMVEVTVFPKMIKFLSVINENKIETF